MAPVPVGESNAAVDEHVGYVDGLTRPRHFPDESLTEVQGLAGEVGEGLLVGDRREGQRRRPLVGRPDRDERRAGDRHRGPRDGPEGLVHVERRGDGPAQHHQALQTVPDPRCRRQAVLGLRHRALRGFLARRKHWRN